MTEQNAAQETAVASSNTGGKQTPIDPEQRKVLDDTQSDAKASAKPEASPGSGFIAAKEEPTQTEEQS